MDEYISSWRYCLNHRKKLIGLKRKLIRHLIKRLEKIPKEFLEIPKKYGVSIDIMCEIKSKEIGIGRLYRQYPKLKPKYTKDIPIDLTKKIIKELELSEEPQCHSLKN